MNENLDLLKKVANVEVDAAIETLNDLQQQLENLHAEKAEKEKELQDLKDAAYNLQEAIISGEATAAMHEELDVLNTKKAEKEEELKQGLQELKDKIFDLQEKIISTQN